MNTEGRISPTLKGSTNVGFLYRTESAHCPRKKTRGPHRGNRSPSAMSQP